VLTRDADVFVPLFTRLSIARAAGADLFISLHADALAQDDAWGASVYTLSEGGDDETTQLLVARHERGDLLAGVDLSQADDRIAATLMDMLRRQTGPRGSDFADQVVAQMDVMGVRLNTKSRRTGRFSVLLAPDFPSVLVEVGFLSNANDRANLTDPAGRARLVTALAQAVAGFAAQPAPR
jgi:N-acetylmuramoyl-L-alanine amidase